MGMIIVSSFSLQPVSSISLIYQYQIYFPPPMSIIYSLVLNIIGRWTLLLSHPSESPQNVLLYLKDIGRRGKPQNPPPYRPRPDITIMKVIYIRSSPTFGDRYPYLYDYRSQL